METQATKQKRTRRVKEGSNKGGRPGWAQADQEAWLWEQLPPFLAAQAGGVKILAEFWPRLFEQWFRQWPEPDPPANPSSNNSDNPMKARKEVRHHAPNARKFFTYFFPQRIKQWFNNHTRASGAKETKAKASLLNLGGRKIRKMPLSYTYSALYYEEKIKPVLGEHWAAHLVEKPGDAIQAINGLPPVWFRNKVAKALYENESAEVQEEVQRQHEKRNPSDENQDKDVAGEDIDEEEAKRRAENMAYQR